MVIRFPCIGFSCPGNVWRSSLGLKVVFLHVVFVCAVFLLDGNLIEKTKTEPWYLIDVRRAFNEANTRIKECSASSNLLGQSIVRNVTSACFDLIIIAFGYGLASDRTITVDSGGIYVQRLPFACGQAFFILDRSNNICRTWRRRITYLRGIPERVYPFSKGIRQNLYRFCCARGRDYYMERVPTQWELETLVRLYTCLDILTCHCC